MTQRTWIAFAVTPLFAALTVAVYLVLGGETTRTAATTLFLPMCALAYAIALAAGIPAQRFFSRKGWTSLLHTIAGCILIGLFTVLPVMAATGMIGLEQPSEINWVLASDCAFLSALCGVVFHWIAAPKRN